MALSYVTYASDGVQVQYDIPFGYLRKQHVFAFINDELRGFKWISNSRIELYVAPQPGDALRLQRLTERAARIVDFTDGQTLLAGDLNAGDLQNFYVMQELIDQIADGLLLGDLTLLNPDGGWITAAWIAEQIDSSAPPAALEGLAALIAAEELVRADAVVAEAEARVAGLIAEALLRVDADTALSEALEIVITRTTASEAAIIANATTSADADSALAVSLAALAARTTTAEANVSTLFTAIADELTARAEAIATVSAAVGVNTADIVTVNEAIVSEALTRASAITAIGVTTGDLQSQITTASSTQIADNAARASEISSVSATLSSRPSGGNIMTNPAMSDITASWSTSAGSAGATGSFPYYVPHPKMPRGWTAYSTSGITDSKQFTIYSPNASVWLPRGVAGFMFYQNGNTAAGYAEAYSVVHPCSVGQRVAVAMRASIHNCTATVYAFFYNSAGTYLGVGTDSTGTFTSGSNPGPAGGGVEDFVRLTRFTTAPDTTRYMRMVIRKNYTTAGSNSYLFASCPQIMFVPDDATDLPPFDGLGDVSGALSAGVAETKVALTDSTGAYAYYGIKVNAGDNSVASIEAMSDTKTSLSKLKLKADKIEMEGDVVINGSLYKEKIAANQATKLSSSYAAAFQSNTPGGWTTQRSLTVTTSGGPLLIIASAFALIGTDSSQAEQQCRITRDGAIIYGPGTFNETFGGDAKSPLTVTLSDTPAAGSRAYLFQTWCTARVDLNTAGCSHRSLAIMESIR